ncbi:hypothetical protein BH23BAC1_BH23BAC1_32990 [soil metagenome]
MKILRTGSKGIYVKNWQYFLLGLELYKGEVDGDFGPKTLVATLDFQKNNGLTPDGIVGNRTIGAALLQGFQAFKEDNWDQSSINWPEKPNFKPILSQQARQIMFGKFYFKPDPLPDDPENIQIIDGWEAENIVTVEIPQLKKITHRSGKIRFHKEGADQILKLWQDWEDQGLLYLVLTWHGSYVSRFIRGSRSVLSNHAFGIAFDINYQWNKLGAIPALVGEPGSVRELVEIANVNGFYWGGHFKNRSDGMHFELAEKRH